MGMWWLGVKGSDITPFEATEMEAKSADFEMQFGVAFGYFNSEIQAQEGMKEHSEYLIKEAEKVLIERQKAINNPQNLPESPLKTSKSAQLGGDVVWDDRNEEEKAEVGDGEALMLVFLRDLEGLKLQIVRCIASGKAVKEQMRENG